MKDYTERFREIRRQREELQLQDIKILQEILDSVGGRYEWVEDEDKPIVAAYVGGEPCDVYVEVAINDNRHGGIMLEVKPKEVLDSWHIPIGDVFDGHIEFIYDYMSRIKED